MKYPYIIFYRLERYSDIDNLFIENNKDLNCSIFFTNKKDDLNKLYDYKLEYRTMGILKMENHENLVFMGDNSPVQRDDSVID